MARTDHVLSQVGIAPDDQAAANRDDFDTARAAGNARTHTRPAPYRPLWRPLCISRRALERIASGETDIIEGWLVYGAALNEGRGLFSGDRGFGQWLVTCNLRLTENDKMERAAAMWAAANQDDFDTARAAGNARTHGPPRPRTGRCGGLDASRGCRAVKLRWGAVRRLWGLWVTMWWPRGCRPVKPRSASGGRGVSSNLTPHVSLF